MLTRISQHYPFASPEYILKKMTWAQVWLYYEACIAHMQEQEYDGEDKAPDEPIRLAPGMKGVIKREDGALVYGK